MESRLPPQPLAQMSPPAPPPGRPPPMADLAGTAQALIGQFVKAISDLLKLFTGMDLNTILQLLPPGKGQLVQQLMGQIFGILNGILGASSG